MKMWQFVASMVLLIAIPASLYCQDSGESRKEPKSDTKAKSKTEREKQLLALCRAEVAGYRIVLTTGDELQLKPREVMVWVNPVRSGQVGVVHVWTHEGRAEAFSSMFVAPKANGTINVVHEFHSLALSPLTAASSGRNTWAPKAPGVELKPIPDAPAPDKSASRRRFQMRMLARQFSAHSIDREKQRWNQRLLPRALYRYEGDSEEMSDGAVFVFVSETGTDPEVILLIEARKTNGGFQWHYAVARFSDLKLYVSHNKKEVWTFTRGSASVFVDAAYENRYRLFIYRVIDGQSLLPQED